MEVNRIYNENCLDTMARMPDGFVDCVITSPPYYGLRSYGTEPQIWDAVEGCEHVWDAHFTPPNGGKSHPDRPSAVGANRSMNSMPIRGEGYTTHFCQLCNAWRGELGLEPTFQLYLKHLIDIFREVKRVLKPDGCVFVNLGDSYAGSGKGIGDKNGHGKSVFTDDHIAKTDWSQITVRAKSLMNIPHRFFIAMTDELQFIQRNNINWHKSACMPSSATDRWTVDFESIGFFTKNGKYKFNQQIETAISPAGTKGAKGSVERFIEAGVNSRPPEYAVYNGLRNQRTTWTIPFEPQTSEHYASYPTKLVERMILAGTNEGDIVFDPFGGTATTALTAHRLGRQWICSELQPKYADIANKRLEPYLAQTQLF